MCQNFPAFIACFNFSLDDKYWIVQKKLLLVVFILRALNHLQYISFSEASWIRKMLFSHSKNGTGKEAFFACLIYPLLVNKLKKKKAVLKNCIFWGKQVALTTMSAAFKTSSFFLFWFNILGSSTAPLPIDLSLLFSKLKNLKSVCKKPLVIGQNLEMQKNRFLYISVIMIFFVTCSCSFPIVYPIFCVCL